MDVVSFSRLLLRNRAKHVVCKPEYGNHANRRILKLKHTKYKNHSKLLAPLDENRLLTVKHIMK